MAYDIFAQIRTHRGQLPAVKAAIGEGPEGSRLNFKLAEAADVEREAKTKGGGSLAALATLANDPEKGIDAKALVEVAAATGPLFGGASSESLQSWQLAAIAAQKVLAVQGGAEKAADAANTVTVSNAKIAPMMKNGFELLTFSTIADFGDASQYAACLPKTVWFKQVAPRTWGFAGIRESKDTKTLYCSVLTSTFDANASDIAATLQHMADAGDEAAALWAKTVSAEVPAKSKPTLEKGTSFSIQTELSPTKGHEEALRHLALVAAQAHMQGVHVDAVGSVPEDQYLAFPAYLSFLWYDFTRSLDHARIGFCPECGKAFVTKRRGAARRFCSTGCSEKNRRRQQQEMLKDLLAKVAGGAELEQTAAELMPGKEPRKALTEARSLLRSHPEEVMAAFKSSKEHALNLFNAGIKPPRQTKR